MGRGRSLTADEVLAAVAAEAVPVASLEDVRRRLGRGCTRTIRRCLAELVARGDVDHKPGKFGVRLLRSVPASEQAPEPPAARMVRRMSPADVSEFVETVFGPRAGMLRRRDVR